MISFVPADALVVVEKISTAIHHGSTAVDLDALDVVRGMAVHTVDAGRIDQRVREFTLALRDGVALITAPMN